MDRARSRRARWLVVAIAVALYAPTLGLGSVDWDDQWLWSSASPLREPDVATARLVFLDLDRADRRPLGSEYLPVRDVSVAIDMAVWGDNERGPHATQVILFALTVLGLGGLLVRFGVEPATAWLGTLVWAAHPIHVESVAWLSERKGLLAALLFVACGHAWVRYRDGRSRAWLAVAALAAVAATWSKAPAMFGPLVLAAWDLLWLPRGLRRWLAIGVVGLATALAALPVIALATEAKVIGSAEAGGDRDGRIATALGAQGHYVASFVLARPPAMTYPIDTDGPSAIDLALGGLAVAGSAGGLAWWWRRARSRGQPVRGLGVALLAWAWLWFLPVSHLVVPVHIVVADRFAYVWSVAGCVGVAWLVMQAPVRLRVAAGGALVLALGIATIRAEEAWTTSIALFGKGCAANPDDVRVCTAFANALHAAGRSQEAIAELEADLVRAPDDPYYLMAHGTILEQKGRRDEALVDAAHAARAGVGTAMAGYAEMLVRAGRPLQAIPWAERAVVRHPEIPAYERLLVAALQLAAKG